MAEQIIPKLREEIELSSTGENQWTLFDKASGKYFRLNELSFAILFELSKADGKSALLSYIPVELECTQEDINETLEFCAKNFLLQTSSKENIEKLIAINAKKTSTPLYTKFIHGYLFFKIHFFNPDLFLDKTVKWTKLFFSKPFFLIMSSLFFINLLFIFNRFAEFTSTLANFVSLEGLVYVAISIVVIKIFHEFGHAYSAKRSGCKVPSMGVAFMVFYPMPYTDTTDVWRLNRFKRMEVALAGIKTEMIIAVFAMIAWLWLPDGVLKSIMFFMIMVSMASTLVVNLTPFMRFDGYYALSDYLGIENLHARSFMQAKAFVKKVLWGINVPVEFFPTKIKVFLILFAITTWIYRVILFSGIAYLVYSHTFKALGIILFWIEVWYFILLPIARELKEWFQFRSQLKFNFKMILGWIAILGFLSILFIPYTATIRLPAVIDGNETTLLYAEYDSQILYVREEGNVKKGDLILSSHSIRNELERKTAQRKLQLFQNQAAIAFVSPETLNDNGKYLESLRGESIKIKNSDILKDNMNLYAPTDGILYYKEKLAKGDFIGSSQQVGYIINPNSVAIKGYIEDVNFANVNLHTRGEFLDFVTLKKEDVTVSKIENTPIESLKEPLLNSNYQGTINVTKNHIPQRPMYEITFNVMEPQSDLLFYQHYGEVKVSVERFSLFEHLLNMTISFIIKESEF